MERYGLRRDDGARRVEVPHRGAELLRSPMYNKGTAFTAEERAAFGLEGLLPSGVATLGQQAERAYRNIVRKTDALERYIGLAALQDRNETLFYRVLADHLEEFLPIVYTPTVGKACQEYSHIFRRARGIWITPGDRGRVEQVLGNAPFEDVRLVVATDNERILGLGDLGAGGMGIPVGKLALYCAAAGIHPALTLPVSLDVGTDNAALRDDPMYLGWRQPRLRGEEYESLVDEFVMAVKRRFPEALLQWEDFKKGNAFRLLERYRRVLPSFNDDIEGTAAVSVAGVMAATRVSGVPVAGQRIVILGAGAAGIGIAELCRHALRRAGVSGDDLVRAVAVLDSRGFVSEESDLRDAYKRPFAWPSALARAAGLGKDQPRDLRAVVEALQPTVLLGTSGEPGTFTEDVVRAMAAHVERPVIFPMSNPTTQSEATPEDVLRWTQGRALVATGSPFDPVHLADGRVVHVGQANNAFIFPGVGLGCLVARAREVSQGMFSAAAEALAAQVTPEDLAAGRLFPRIAQLRHVTARVAEAVVREARDAGLGQRIDDRDVAAAVAGAMWEPQYLPLTVPARTAMVGA